VLKSKTKSKPSVAVAVDTSNCVNDSHVDDMNVSNGTSRHYLQILTTSVNCDEGRERQHQAVIDDIQASQNDNASRTSLIDTMTKVRLSAGGMTRNGIWALSQTALQIVEKKNKAKLNALAGRASKQYIRDMKIYSSGKIVMDKSIYNYAACAEGGSLYGVPIGADRNRIITTLRKARRWLLNDDYAALIKYKQLSMKIRPKIPLTLVGRRDAWDSIYFIMNEPSPPVKPDNFTDVVADDDEEEEGIDIETLAGVNADLPRTAASIEHFEAAQSLFTLTMTDECADPDYHGAQMWNTQLEENNLKEI
jgi:hypothetical protein